MTSSLEIIKSSHLLYFIPTILQTLFYTSNSLIALRIVALGYIVSSMLKSYLPFILCALFSITNLLSTIQLSSLNFDIYSYYSLFSSLFGILSATIYIYSQYNYSVKISLISSVLICFSVMLSISVFSISIFDEKSVFVTGIIFSCIKPLYGLLSEFTKENKPQIEQTVGFGVQSIKDDIFQNFEESVGILTIASILFFTIFNNFIGNFYQGIAWILIIFYCIFLMVFSASITYLIRQKKGFREYFRHLEEISPLQKDDKAYQANSEKKIKQIVSEIFKINLKEYILQVIIYAIYTSVASFYYGYKFNALQFLLTIPIAFLSQRAIFMENGYVDILFLVANLVCLYNYPLVAFIHFTLFAVINKLESKPFSTYLIVSAEFCSIAFIDYNQYQNIWIANLLITVLLSLQFLPVLLKSPLGINVIIYIQSFILDTVITIPREYQINILTNSYILLATAVYAQKFMNSVIGEYQSMVIFITILIRVIGNITNALLLRPGLGIEAMFILQNVVNSYGAFSICVSLIIQLTSYVKIPKKLQIFAFAVVYMILTFSFLFSPLSVVFITGFLYTTGFSQIISSTFSFSSSTLQSVTVLIYQSFFDYKIPSPMIFLARFLTGISISSFCGIFLHETPYFLSTFTAAISTLFLVAPSVMLDFESSVLQINKFLVSVIIFSTISFLPISQKISQQFFKFIYLGIYAILIIVCVLSSQISESFVLLVFLVLLASTPQSLLILSLVFPSIFLLLILQTRYAAVTVSYPSAVTTFSILQIMFLLRFIMIKNSSLRRLMKKVKITTGNVNINSKAFTSEEGEFDVFLNSPEAENKGTENNRETPEKVYLSLQYQLYAFIGISAYIFTKFGFSELILLLLSVSTFLLPSDQVQNGEIVQIAGYFGVNCGFSSNIYNKQQKISRFANCCFVLVVGRVLYDFGLFLLFLMSDYEANSIFVGSMVKDVVVFVFVMVFSVCGLTLITAKPTNLFLFLANQKRVLMTILALISTGLAAFTISNGIKLLLIFGYAGIWFQAPKEYYMGEKRTVDVEG